MSRFLFAKEIFPIAFQGTIVVRMFFADAISAYRFAGVLTFFTLELFLDRHEIILLSICCALLTKMRPKVESGNMKNKEACGYFNHHCKL